MEGVVGNQFEFGRTIREMIKVNDISNAISKIVENSELDNDVRLLNHQAHCSFVLGDFQQATELWSRVLKLDPKNVKATMSLSEINSPSFQAWLKRFRDAIDCMENKNYEKAVIILRALLEEKEGIIAVYQLLGISYLACGDHNNARKIWSKGMAIDRSNPLLQKYLGIFEDKAQHLPVTEEIKREIAFDFSKSLNGAKCKLSLKKALVAASIVGIAFCYPLYKKPDISFSVVDPSFNNESWIAVAPAIEVFALDGKQQEVTAGSALHNDQAIESSELALIDENHSNELSNQEAINFDEHSIYSSGMSAYRSKDWNTAIEQLSIVTKMNTGNYINREALYYLARVYYLNAEWEAAIKHFEIYLDKFPDSIYYDDSLYFLGRINNLIGNRESARNIFLSLKNFDSSSTYLTAEDAVDVLRNN